MANPSSPPTPLPSLRVPVEILERILDWACLVPQVNPLRPAPCPPPLSLLLVSHAVTALVTPFYYRSITIYKPLDWSSLFDSERGLMVVGQLAATRREAVVELIIRSESVPVDTPRVEALLASRRREPKEINDFLVPIANVTFPNLSRLYLLAEPTRVADVWDVNKASEGTLARRLTDFSRKEGGTTDYDRWLANVIGPRREDIYQQLLGPPAPVRSVHLTLQHNLYDLVYIYAKPCPSAIIYVHCQPSDFVVPPGEMPCRGETLVRPPAFEWLIDLSYGEQDIALVGIPDKDRVHLATLVKKHKIDNFFYVETRTDGSLKDPVPLVN